MTLDVSKMLILAIFMYGTVRCVLNFLGGLLIEDTIFARILLVGLPAGFGAVVYMIGTLILKVPEARFSANWIINKLKGEKMSISTKNGN